MNKGVPPPALNARTGELTPPGMRRCARANSSSDCVIAGYFSGKSEGGDTAAMATRSESSETDENAPGRAAGLRVLLVHDDDDTRGLLPFVLAPDGYVRTD